MTKKRCTKCRRLKTLEAFRDRKYASGLIGKRARCKECENAGSLEGYYAHRGQWQKRQRAYRQRCAKREMTRRRKYNSTHRKEKAAYAKKYALTHHEAMAAHAREYYQAHRKERRAYVRKYAPTHPEQYAAARRRRRAKQLAVQENFTPKEARFIRSLWNNRCAVCGKTRKEEGQALAIDHWLPLSKGHALTMENAVLLCRSCNSTKSDKYPVDAFGPEIVKRVGAFAPPKKGEEE